MKMEFALRRPEQYREPDGLLLEEPEDYLCHVNMKKLMNTLAPEGQMQLFVSRHSSHISSRPDLRSAILPKRAGQWLCGSSPKIRHVFYQGPDINMPKFGLARRVILVDGEAGFILTDVFYRNLTNRAPEDAGVHIVAIGGTRFRW